ncbi:sensor domain-containing diguanylate cyclase [Evansella tamaricis]|uniref:Sensor domain-containing diguanylate cyclase n=1 Tax=Evansella tamaricis TaxID=2069301 RepID=A0ABS6JDT0_9BACI|nr:sensor domain-containing diguanylate cyclase [Evansella tamaricis]MBU9711007.1 sensor domain-containing diguanylate cyclase [Evansella tamaricis]
MPKSVRLGSTIIWLFVFPIFLFIFFQESNTMIQEHWVVLLSFLCLNIIVSFFPIRLGHTNIIPLQGISLAVFLQFGLLVEMFIMQVAIITSLMRIRLTKQELYRIPVNSLLFLTVSLISGLSYYLVGGTTGNISEVSIMTFAFPILVYAFMYFFINHCLLFLIKKYLVGQRDIRFITDAFKWEGISGILIIPVGVTLVLLYQEIGVIAIFLIGIPLFILSIILKLYNRSETTKSLLQKVSNFGYKVNANLPEDKIIELIIHTITTIFPAKDVYLYEKRGEKLTLLKSNSNDLVDGRIETDGISNKVLEYGESLLFTHRKFWRLLDRERGLSVDAHSIVSVPVIHNQKVVGVITMTSNQIRAFGKSDMMLLEIMANYLAVAIENARNYEKKKHESEQCALTNLYNFRYFESLLMEKYDNPTSEDEFAVILLDLDHFKKINDTYGHQSGNEVLRQVSDVIKKIVGNSGTVARYGGEEFVILLEGEDSRFVEDMAEAVRESIETQIFRVTDDLKKGERRSVRLTASIGVAIKSEDNETAMSVLRNADRAMYTGAKQKGRNRVSHFS